MPCALLDFNLDSRRRPSRRLHRTHTCPGVRCQGVQVSTLLRAAAVFRYILRRPRPSFLLSLSMYYGMLYHCNSIVSLNDVPDTLPVPLALTQPTPCTNQ